MSSTGVRNVAHPRSGAAGAVRSAPCDWRRFRHLPEGRHMNRRLLTAVGATALLLGSALPAATTAASPAPSRQFTRLDVSKIDPSDRPGDARQQDRDRHGRDRRRAQATTGKATKAQQVAAAKALKASQDKIKPAIAAAGGKVLGQYQYAYNGIKVRIPAAHVAALAALPGVDGVHGVADLHDRQRQQRPLHRRAPAAWTDLGVTGPGQTIAVIDTGIDYTHANFGGAGTGRATTTTTPTMIEPGTFPTAKVVGGWDFVGDDYDATERGRLPPIPHPGSRSARLQRPRLARRRHGRRRRRPRRRHRPTPAPYNATTYAQLLRDRPGRRAAGEARRPEGLRLRGLDRRRRRRPQLGRRLQRAPADAIDVVNMSLGAPFGRADNPDAVATNNARQRRRRRRRVGRQLRPERVHHRLARRGDPGDLASPPRTPWRPSRARSSTSRPRTDITNANNQNAYPNLPVSGTLKVIYSAPGVVSLGCTAADYGTLPANTVVAIQRGVCAFVDKGAAAQAAGAIGDHRHQPR